MTHISRRTALKTLGALGVAGVAGTGTVAAGRGNRRAAAGHRTDDDSTDAARVRVAHASPNAPAVDVYLDGTRAVSGLAFTGIAPDFTAGPAYLEVPEGRYDVKITAAGDPGTVAFEGPVPLAGDLTVAAVGELGVDESDHGASGPDRAFRPILIPDDLDLLPPGLTSVRAVHASPDAPPVQVSVGGLTVFDSLAFGEWSGVATVTPGTKTVTIAAAADPDTVVFEGDLTFEAGTAYTAFAEGYLTTDGEPADEPFRPVVAAAPADPIPEGIEEQQAAVLRRVEAQLDGDDRDDDEDDEKH
jgi:hypothetical protein